MSANEPKKDTLAGATKGDIQKAVAIGFLGIFGVVILYMVFFSGKIDVKITGTIDVNTFIGPFIGIIIAMIGWLGFKMAQGK